MYTVNSVWNVQCTTHSVVGESLQLWSGFLVDFLLNSYKSKYTIRSCVRSKNVFESWKEGEGGLCFAGPWPTSRAPLCCMIAHCCGWIAHTQMKMMLMQSFPLETLQWRVEEFLTDAKAATIRFSAFGSCQYLCTVMARVEMQKTGKYCFSNIGMWWAMLYCWCGRATQQRWACTPQASDFWEEI